jgi:CRISPR-associated endonuclease/helicase Cas3
MAYAHSSNDHGVPQDLVAHLQGVAAIASEAASDLGCAEIGRFLGLWHDLGKFSPAFQAYLAACEANPARTGHGPDHKAAGALLAEKQLRLLALLVHGHHGGLKNPTTDFRDWLARKRGDPDVDEALTLAARSLPDLLPPEKLALPPHVLRDPLAAEFFLRMLFSALVDADYLDTEHHFGGGNAQMRGSSVTMTELWQRFERHHQRLPSRSSGTVAEVRRSVYEACLAAAESAPGIFRLAVPTGGGKTLSGIAFALRHALKHGHRRIVVAVPFISITQQTAEVYRDVFGADGGNRPTVLEHHSAAFMQEEGNEYETDREWQRLAAENWDAPIIVTTTVQLF